MPLSAGTRLGHYDVTALIGEGGMGQVWQATDTQLNRQVALKILPDAFATDPDRLARFKREAQILASLNHPNIAAIYGIEEAEGTRALVLELVEGPTLADRIAKGPIPLDEALPIAKQIAEALEAAHEAGVIHRDLKPANIKVREDGTVKVLDFGLAKALDPTPATDPSQSPTLTAAATQMGVIMGTAAYMSPEQATGKVVDKRADIWAFGCVLYEMSAGRPVFAGATVSETLARVLEREPDFSFLPVDAPLALRRLLRRCLAKDRRQRLQHIGDARLEIGDSELTGAASEESVSGASPGPARRPGVIAVAVLVVFAAVALGYALRSFLGAVSDPLVPRLENAVRVTSALGVEYPALSPDGARLAYSSEESGTADIWVLELGSGQAVNRTAGRPGSDTWPQWSPDGRQVAFHSTAGGESAIWVMDAFAGAPRRVATVGVISFPHWSADGSGLAYLVDDDSADGTQLLVERYEIETDQSRRLPLLGVATGQLESDMSGVDLTWSPDGRFFAYLDTVFGRNSLAHRVWVMRADDGHGVPVTDRQTSEWSPTFSPDGSTLFYASNRGGTYDLWQQSIDDTGAPVGDALRLTSGMEIWHATLSGDGTKLAYVKGRRIVNLWRVPILEEPATWSDAEQLTFDRAWLHSFDLSPDGKRLSLTTDRSGNWDLWVMAASGGVMNQVTTGITPEWAPDWSPDGRQIAYHGTASGNWDIWRMPADGGAATRVTTSDATDVTAAWSPDGRSIAFRSLRGESDGIWIIPAEGGDAEPVTMGQMATSAVWAPDGQSIAFVSAQRGSYDLWSVPATGGEPTRLTQSYRGRPAYSPDGEKLYHWRDANLWEFSLTAGGGRPLTDLEGRYGEMSGQSLDTDGHYLYFLWIEDEGDVWVADLTYDEGAN